VIGSCLVHSSAFAGSWQIVQAKVQEQVDQIKRDAQLTQDSIREEREKLLAELESLKKVVEQEELELESREENLKTFLQKETQMRSQLETEEGEMELLEGIIRSAAEDADALVRTSFTTAQSPSRLEVLTPLMDAEHFPGIEDVQNLVNLLFSEMETSGEIRKETGPFVNDEGKEVTGEILRVGTFTAFYRLSHEVGYLRYDEKGTQFVMVSAKPSWFDRRTIKKYLTGKTDELPMDLSGGVIFEQLSSHRGVWRWLRSGGILVWPILIVGFVALVLILERSIFLTRARANTDDIMREIQSLAPKALWQECQDLCLSYAVSPTCNVLSAGLQHLGATREALGNAIEEAILRELPRLERFLSTISVLAAIAPLLGLLGTVTGMINTFRVITIYGTGDPRMMSGGISEALITTQLGLAVAIPILMAHHFLERQVDKIIGDMEEKGTALTVTLLKNEGIRDGVVHRAA
jgi:biopolymer transport protein ExbB